jgi:hypothetical protein
MSGFIPGYASPGIPLYEADTDLVIATQFQNLQDTPLIPDTPYTEKLTAIFFTTPPSPFVQVLLDMVVEIDVNNPDGDEDKSIYFVRYTDNLDNPIDLNKDVYTQFQYDYDNASQDKIILRSTGLLVLDYKKSMYVSILRTNATAGVSTSISQIYKRYKQLN